MILVFSGTVPAVLAAGGDAGGGNEVHLDYEIHVEQEEEHDSAESYTKTIDIESLDGPLEYRVAIWLNNVGKIENESGVYELDFWYIISSEDVNFLEVGTPPVTFTNSKVTHMESEYVEEHYYEVRVRGTFFNILDYHGYPFENIDLNVEIEPNSPYFIENTVLVVDEELVGVDDVVNVVGWEIGEPVFDTNSHEYENYGTFSRFVASIPLERSTTGALLKTIFPVLVITAVSMLIFIIPENFSSRIYLTAPLLLAVVFLHRASMGELPTLSYMTIFDKFMVIIYALFANSILSIGLQMRYHTEKKYSSVKRINRIMLYIVPILVVVLVGLLYSI